MHPRLPLLFLASALLAAHSPLTAASLRTIAGTGVKGFSGDGGPATAAQINNPFGVVRGPDGNLWFCEYGGQRIRTISSSGTIRTVAGNGQTGYTGDGGPATAASLNQPHEIRFDRAGDLYIVDMQNHAVRKVVLSTGLITTIVGTGKPGYSGDAGPATAAQLNQPHSIQFDSAGDLYICDIRNHVIRKVTTQTGVITTFAGTGKPGDTPDNSPIVGTPLRGPRTLDFDSAGHLWLATREGNQVFRFDLTAGRIYHRAGTGKKASPATTAPRSPPRSPARKVSPSVATAASTSSTPKTTPSASSIRRPSSSPRSWAWANSPTAPTATVPSPPASLAPTAFGSTPMAPSLSATPKTIASAP